MNSNAASSRSLLYQQQPQRPQSLLVPSITFPLHLQCLQKQPSPFPLLFETEKLPTTATNQQHNHQQLNKFGGNAQHQGSTSKIGRSSPHPFANASSEKQHYQRAPPQKKEKDHPQIWCGKGQIEPASSKHVYNYAQQKDSTEKTPMCRVAELARYNKLRHEYILLDESGPAHKKKFTVKLTLCPGQEFEGSGASIKKAQQAAAQCALDSTNLPRVPTQMRTTVGGAKRPGKKDEPNTNNPIILLNSVAAQLGIAVQYRDEMIRQPMTGYNKSNTMITTTVPISPSKHLNMPIFPNFTSPTLPQLCYPPTALLPSPSKMGLASILDLTMASPVNNRGHPFPLALPPPFSFVDPKNGFSLFPSCLSLPSTALLQAGIPPTPTNGPSLLGPINHVQNIIYKVTITLSLDASEHVGISTNFSNAKQKAATLALAHLKPELERFKRDKEEENDNNNPRQFTAAIATTEKKNRLPSPQSGRSSSSITESESATPEHEEEQGESPCLPQIDDDDTFGNGDVKADENENQQQPILAAEIPTERHRPRRKTKSVVSQIHECALHLRMNVEFEVLSETGEPHNRVYTLRCRLITPSAINGATGGKEYVADGQGPSKKSAKQAACQQLLDQVRQLVDNDPIQLASQIVKQTANAVSNQHKAKVIAGNGLAVGGGGVASKEHGKRKTIIKDKKMDPEYGHHINPISRLIQVMQARQEREPIFQLVSEQGQNRHREFTVTVQCMGFQEQGVGPNKKLAKRSAAEVMLARIGYVKPMPQPGKSLLKKRADQNGMMDFMEIGHFDANEAANENTWMEVGEWQTQSADGSNKKQQRMDALETFADVENALQDEVKTWEFEPNKQQQQTQQQTGTPPVERSPEYALNSSSSNGDDVGAIRCQRRRVTFSEQVSACPPPEDSNYPAASIAPLKTDLGGRLKRRSRDSQRTLTAEETKKMSNAVKQFMSWRNVDKEKRGLINLGGNEDWKGLVDEIIEAALDEATAEISDSKLKSLVTPQIPAIKPLLMSPPPVAAHSLASLAMSPSSPLVTSPSSLLPSHQPPFIGHKAPPSILSTSTGFGGQCVPPPPFTNTTAPPPQLQCPSIFTKRGSLDGLNGSDIKVGLISAKAFLEHLAKLFKFTVAFSDFPKTKNAAGEEQCFTLLTVGLAKPIVCHGSGATETDAHNDASFNALRNLQTQLETAGNL